MGLASKEGVGFSPGFKVGYNVTRKLTAGLEYYGSVGPVFGFDQFALQQEQLVPAIDYDFGPNWEFNIGMGIGITHSTDHLLLKMIVGRRFRFITPQVRQALRRFRSSENGTLVATGAG